MSRRRRQSRLVDLEWRAQERAKDAAARAVARVRALGDADLVALVAHADANPDMEFFTPEDFCAALQWPRERLVEFLFGKEQLQ